MLACVRHAVSPGRSLARRGTVRSPRTGSIPAQLAVRTTARSDRDANVGGGYARSNRQPAMQTDFLRRAQYRVTVELPNRPARTITINIEVERPPSTRAQISIEPASALDPAHLL